MNYFQLISIVAQILNHPEFKKRKGTFAAYAATRLIAKNFQDNTPGLAQEAGFINDIPD